MSTSTTCSLPGCRRRTKNSTGRCHDHRSPVAALTRLPPGVPGAPPVPTGPIVSTNRNGTRSEKWFDADRELHRDGGPASTLGGPNGKTLVETYYRHGEVYREDGPAVTYYSARGTLIREEWHRNGGLHRIDGPARIEYRDNGEIRGASYRIDGEYLTSVEIAMVRVAAYDDERLVEEFASSGLAELADDGPDRLRRYLDGLAAEITTTEGLRAYADGSPIEWVRAFEESRS